MLSKGNDSEAHLTGMQWVCLEAEITGFAWSLKVFESGEKI